jgi:hypothetical protein
MRNHLSVRTITKIDSLGAINRTLDRVHMYTIYQGPTDGVDSMPEPHLAPRRRCAMPTTRLKGPNFGMDRVQLPILSPEKKSLPRNYATLDHCPAVLIRWFENLNQQILKIIS